MSPIIYEVLDFAAVLYDRRMRLLAQAPSLPFFMGTMSFCIEAAVEEVGGEDGLDPGDIILMNDPYKTGSHPQDAAVVMPVFLPEGELVGYSAIKAHWLDIGAKEIYCTDTTDVFQEGDDLPRRQALPPRRARRGHPEDGGRELARCRSSCSATSTPRSPASAQARRELVRLVERYGLEAFANCVERMYDHGEAVVRSYIEKLPDGRYVGRGEMDDDGISDEAIPFEVVLEIEGTTAAARLLQRAGRARRARSTARSRRPCRRRA